MPYPTSDRFPRAVRSSGGDISKCQVWRDGEYVSDVEILGGSGVQCDGATPGMTRTLTLNTVASAAQWDLLTPAGTVLKPFRGPRYTNGATELLPLGVFEVDVERMGYRPDGNIGITAPDQWARVQRARLTVPEVCNGRLVDEAIRLILGAFPTAAQPTVIRTATSTAKVTESIVDRDRAAGALDMLKSAGAEAFFDADGALVVRDVATMSAAPSWTVDAGVQGVFLGGDRERSKQRTYNCIVVTADGLDGFALFDPVIVDDEDPASPTFVSEPADRVPYFYSSPLVETPAQARTAGQALLEQKSALASQLTLESLVNPALAYGDVIWAVFPDKTVERHLVESFNVPLDVTTPQTITTRSNRPDDEAGES